MTKKVVQGSRYSSKSTLCLKELITHELLKGASTEALLKELIDRRVISSWYYNGSYHVGNKKNDIIDAMAYAIYYTANPNTKMCILNCVYEKAEKMFAE